VRQDHFRDLLYHGRDRAQPSSILAFGVDRPPGGTAPVTEDIRKLIAYRLDQAAETLDVAKELCAAGHYRDAVNRAYYAMFYCGRE
jgi:hypothetical protein